MQSASPNHDFDRDAWCLFGLPIDNLGMDSAKALLYKKLSEAQGVVLSTVNINWVVQALKDPVFYRTILNSDIITIDGKPLLWFAKLLGLPMTELVPGSSLIDSLQQKSSRRPLSMFLFGGEKDIAQKALENVNATSGGLIAVGAMNPGFGTVREMSQRHVIDQINAGKPDILLVALGANKGAYWIEANRKRLNAGIISHLGATINFLAGNVQRAPMIMRHLGLEWFWRILQEPKLFSRYLNDGLFMLRWLAGHYMPLCRFMRMKKAYRTVIADNEAVRTESDTEIILCLGRKMEAKNRDLRLLFERYANAGKNLVLDFRKTEMVDASFLGLCLLLLKFQNNTHRKLSFINLGRHLQDMFRLFGMEDCLRGTVSEDVQSKGDI